MGRGGRLRVVDTVPREEVPESGAWQRAIETGDRSALLPQAVRELIAEAGKEGRLTTEIGALRVVAERLLAEVGDAAQLATLLPRLVNAIVRAMQAQRALGGEEDDELVQLVNRALALANTRAAERAAADGAPNAQRGGADDDR